MKTPDEEKQAELDAKKAADEAKAKEEALKAERDLPFNDQQQQKVNELIASAEQRGFAAGGKNNAEKLANLKKELEEATAKGSTGDVDVEEMKKQIAALNDVLAKGQARTVNAALVTAIGPHNVVNPQQVADLLRSQIHVDEDGKLTIQSPTGALKVNGKGDPMTVDEFIGGWLAANPHHKRPAGGPGAGSKAGDYQEKGEAKTITRKEFDALSLAEQSKIGRDKDIKIVD